MNWPAVCHQDAPAVLQWFNCSMSGGHFFWTLILSDGEGAKTIGHFVNWEVIRFRSHLTERDASPHPLHEATGGLRGLQIIYLVCPPACGHKR